MTTLDIGPKEELRARARDTSPRHGGDDGAEEHPKRTALPLWPTADSWAALGERVRNVDLMKNSPASLADLVAHVQRGDMVPGERHPVLEWTGWLYGWLLAIPLSATLYSAAWVLQHEGRIIAFLVVLLALLVAT